MSLQRVSGLSFDFGGLKPVEIEVSEAPLTSDAGLLPVRQLDERLRIRLSASLPHREHFAAVSRAAIHFATG